MPSLARSSSHASGSLARAPSRAPAPKKKAAPKKKSSGGGGLWGAVTHAVGQGASDLAHVAKQTPAGLYATAKAVGKDYQSIQSGHIPKENAKLFKAMGVSTVKDLRHPLRHPGYTALDVLMLASLGAGTTARFGSVGKVGGAARVAGRAAKVAGKSPAKAIAKEVAFPKPKRIKLTVDNVHVEIPASKSALSRSAQRTKAKAYNKASTSDSKVAAPVKKLAVRKHGKELKRETVAKSQQARGPGIAVQRAGFKLSKPQETALKVVAEGLKTQERIRYHERLAASATKKSIHSNHVGKAQDFQAAAKYLDESGTHPKISAKYPKLQQIQAANRGVASARQKILLDLGELHPKTIAERLVGPAKAMGHDITVGPYMHYLPHTARKGLTRGDKVPVMGAGGTFGDPVRSGSLKQTDYALQRQGKTRDKTTQLMAEAHHEAVKLGDKLTLRERLKPAAVPTIPEGKSRRDYVLMRFDKKPLPTEIRDILEHPNEFDPEVVAGRVQRVHDFFFPEKKGHLTAEESADLAAGNLAFVPKKMLGGMDDLHLPSNDPTIKAVRGTFDAVNNASRTADLYLKVSYAAPNMGGNALLNLTQQGVFAPVNLAKSVLLMRKANRDLKAWIDGGMGQGSSTSIAIDTGIGHSAVQAMANVWGKVVDEPFRQAAFLHEARREGYGTIAKLDKLRKDSQAGDRTAQAKVLQIQKRANSAAIQYDELNAFEKSVVRRVVFFYPWVKGSTRYAGKLVRDHPQTTAYFGQSGKEGQKKYGFAPGEMPSYLEGALKAGPNRFYNPNALSLLGSPAQAEEILGGLMRHDPRAVARAAEMFTPALNAGGALAFGLNRFGESQPGGTTLRDVLYQQLQATPQFALVNRILNGGSATFPIGTRDAIMQYLIGGLASRPYDPHGAQKSAYLEQHPPRH